VLPQEIEIKLDLQNEENYLKLIDFFDAGGNSVRQSNYFFDTRDNALSSLGWACRIRIEDDRRAFMTLKGPREKSSVGPAVRTEIEEKMDLMRAGESIEHGMDISDLTDGLKQIPEAAIEDEKLSKKLSFENHRTSISYALADRSINLEMDRTVFSDGSIDYEVEIELAEMSTYESILEGIRNLFEELSIPVVIQSKSKYRRALEKEIDGN